MESICVSHILNHTIPAFLSLIAGIRLAPLENRQGQAFSAPGPVALMVCPLSPSHKGLYPATSNAAGTQPAQSASGAIQIRNAPGSVTSFISAL